LMVFSRAYNCCTELAHSNGEWVGCIEFRGDVRDEESGEWKEPVEDPTVQCTDESGNEVHVSR
jgi:hypothetical protein